MENPNQAVTYDASQDAEPLTDEVAPHSTREILAGLSAYTRAFESAAAVGRDAAIEFYDAAAPVHPAVSGGLLFGMSALAVTLYTSVAFSPGGTYGTQEAATEMLSAADVLCDAVVNATKALLGDDVADELAGRMQAARDGAEDAVRQSRQPARQPGPRLVGPNGDLLGGRPN